MKNHSNRHAMRIVTIVVLSVLSASVFLPAEEWPINSSSASTSLPGWEASKGVDNNPGTVWSSSAHTGANSPEWFSFGFGAYHDVNYIKLIPRSIAPDKLAIGFPVTFTIHCATLANQGTATPWGEAVRIVHSMPRPYAPEVILRLPKTAGNCYGILISASVLGQGSVSAQYIAQMVEFKAGFTAPGVWQRDSVPLLTNFQNMYQPCVVDVGVQPGNDYRHRMWFFGWAADDTNTDYPGQDAVYHARSKDLQNWEVLKKDDTWDTTMSPRVPDSSPRGWTANWKAVLFADTTRWYDSGHNGDPSVVYKNGTYYIAYSATSERFPQPVAGYPSQRVLCVMGATSIDGIHWTKIPYPLLIRAGDDAAPVPEPDRIGDFHRPCLVWDNGRWKMWFDYWVPSKGICLGYAENTGDFAQMGGFVIQHAPAQPLLVNWVNPDIVKVGNKYIGFGDPTGYPAPAGSPSWMKRQLCEMESDDGIHWRRLGFILPDADASACHVPQALLATEGDSQWLYLFYATQIGYRNSADPADPTTYDYRYDRIRAMRRSVP